MKRYVPWAALPREQALVLLCSVGIFLSRVPFMLQDYGRDLDAWGFIFAAQQMARTGVHVVSRRPGYPVPEMAYSLVWELPPVVPNALTALMSAVAAGFFMLLLQRLGCRAWLAGGIALAALPVIMINSTTTMDYVWALGFLLASLYWVVVGRPLLAGVALGLAIGSRITSGAALLPFGLLLVTQAPTLRAGLARLVIFGATAASVALALFTPVFAAYGWQVLRYAPGTSTFEQLWHNATVGAWGVTGLYALALLPAGLIERLVWRRSTPALQVGTWHSVAWLLMIGVYALIFVQLPIEPGYLIPAVPFVILLLARVLPVPWFWLACGLLSLSSFVTIDATGLHRGTFLEHEAFRAKEHQIVSTLLEQARCIPEPAEQVTVVTSLYMKNRLLVLTYTDPALRQMAFDHALDVRQVARQVAQGRTVYATPEKRHLVEAGARPLATLDLAACAAFQVKGSRGFPWRLTLPARPDG